MEKINFKDLPNTDTPINSSNLNQLQTNVENAINDDTGWLDLNDYIKYRKKNGIVFVCGYGKNEFKVGNGFYTTVGTLPEGFRPATTIWFTWTGISADVKNQSARVNNEGAIGLYLLSGQSTENWGFTVSYPID